MEGIIRTALKEEVGDEAVIDLRMNGKWIDRALEEKVGEKIQLFGLKLASVEIPEVREV